MNLFRSKAALALANAVLSGQSEFTIKTLPACHNTLWRWVRAGLLSASTGGGRGKLTKYTPTQECWTWAKRILTPVGQYRYIKKKLERSR